MFQLPTYLSLTLDALIVILYFNDPVLVGDAAPVRDNSIDPLKSYLLFGVLAVARMGLYLPYIWKYHRDERLMFPMFPYLWLFTNIVLLVVKTCDNIADNLSNSNAWFMLLASGVSVLLQSLALNHLKSSAAVERYVAFGLYPEEGLAARSSEGAQGASSRQSQTRSRSSDLIDGMKKRLDLAQEAWNKNIARFQLRMGVFGASSQDEFGPAFRHVVALFRGDLNMTNDANPINELKALFNTHPYEIEFYIPQITIFFMYGSFGHSEAFKAFLFDMCSRSPIVAHKIRWFIQSFCLTGAGIGGSGLQALQQFIATVEANGTQSANYLLSVPGAHPALGLGQSKVSVSAVPSSPGMSTVISSRSSSGNRSLSADQVDKSKIRNPLVPRIPRGIADYPLHRTIEFVTMPSGGLSRVDAFKPTVSFWEDLVLISRELCPLPKEERLGELRKKLAILNSTYLPSACVFAPVGHLQHRIWNIHVEESFAFSTKERAPLFLCLEVVDYDTAHRKSGAGEGKKWWSFTEIKKTIGKVIHTDSSNASDVPDVSKVLLSNSSHDDLEAAIVGASTNRSYADKNVAVTINSSDEVNDVYNFSADDSTFMQNAPAGSRSPIAAPLSPDRRDLVRSPPNPLRSRVMSAPDEVLEKEVGQWAQVTVATSLQSGKPATSGKGFTAISKWLSEAKGGFGMSSDGNGVKASERSTDAQSAVSDGSAPSTYGTMRRDVVMSSKDSHRSMSADARMGGNFSLAKVVKEPSDHSGSTDYRSDYSGVIRMSYDEENDFAIGRYNSEPAPKPPANNATPESGQPLVVFKEAWAAKQSRIQGTSPVGSLPGWRLLPIIVKSGDDLRQEQVVSQLIFQMYFIVKKMQVGVWIRPYGIIATSADSGVIEAIPDTVSLDVLRRCVPSYTSLIDFYERFYGDRTSEAFREARENFVKSLAGYSIICYLLQIKDRHNGNILIDNRGHIMHIDFGFVFGLTPGGNMGFEKAPFKLTQEMIELMGGLHSSTFHRYRDYCVKTFMALRKEHHRIVLLLEMMSHGSSHLKFFGADVHNTVEGLRARFCPDMNDSAAIERVHQLIDAAANNWTTTCYDKYQRYFTGVL